MISNGTAKGYMYPSVGKNTCKQFDHGFPKKNVHIVHKDISVFCSLYLDCNEHKELSRVVTILSSP